MMATRQGGRGIFSPYRPGWLMTQRLTRNEQVIKYLLARCGKISGRTRLLKFVYLADYFSHLYRGKPISGFRYVKWDHGPFDKAFYTAVKSLKVKGLLADERVEWEKGDVFAFLDKGGLIPFTLALAEIHILNRVAELFLSTELKELLEETVYETEPWKAVQGRRIGTPIDLHAFDNRSKKRIGGLDIDTMLQSRQEIREGRHFVLGGLLPQMPVGVHSSNG